MVRGEMKTQMHSRYEEKMVREKDHQRRKVCVVLQFSVSQDLLWDFGNVTKQLQALFPNIHRGYKIVCAAVLL
jgi:hypothetical protein